MAFEVPDLPYAYDALEPHIDEATMRVHHDKHHQAYVDKANAALEGTEWADRSVEDVLTNLSSLPGDKQGPVRNNAGGHYNHSLFWKMMSPDGGGEPTGDIAGAITDTFGSFDSFKDEFKAAGIARFGSGWAWLVKDSSGPRGRLDPEPGHAALRRLLAAARRRRLGARLLPEVPEQTSRLPRRLLERRQLGLRERAVRGGVGPAARQAAPPPPGGAAAPRPSAGALPWRARRGR
jgi:superoxide dismutase